LSASERDWRKQKQILTQVVENHVWR